MACVFSFVLFVLFFNFFSPIPKEVRTCKDPFDDRTTAATFWENNFSSLDESNCAIHNPITPRGGWKAY